MIQPLALVFYERLLPGTQLVNLLRDHGYRVQVVTDAAAVASAVVELQPMLLLADLQVTQGDIAATIRHIRSTPATAHLPVLAFAGEAPAPTLAAARQAGATLIVQDQTLLSYLPQLLEQALHVE